MLFLIFNKWQFTVIISYDISYSSELILIIRCKGKHSGASRVQIMHKIIQHRCPLHPHVVFASGFCKLVANAPEHYRRMITVSDYHVRYVLLPTGVKELGIISWLPFIKSLIYYQESYRVAKIEKFRWWWIVGTPDCIGSELFQYLQTPLICPVRDCSAETAGILMETHPFHLDVLAVEEESFFRIKLNRTNAKTSTVCIDRLSFSRYYSLQGINIGIVKIP